jgi:hypothetical protein
MAVRIDDQALFHDHSRRITSYLQAITLGAFPGSAGCSFERLGKRWAGEA